MLIFDLQIRTKKWYNISDLTTWLHIYGHRDGAIDVTELKQYISGYEQKYDKLYVSLVKDGRN